VTTPTDHRGSLNCSAFTLWSTLVSAACATFGLSIVLRAEWLARSHQLEARAREWERHDAADELRRVSIGDGVRLADWTRKSMARLSIDYPLIDETAESLRDTLIAYLLFCLHVTTKVPTLQDDDKRMGRNEE
jgi:hypothetical protein